MSRFLTQFAAKQGLLDNQYGEPLEVRHILAGEFIAGAADPARPAFRVVGVLDTPDVIVQGAGTMDGAKSELVASHPTVDFAVSAFTDTHPRPVKGTVIVAVDRPGAPHYRILSVLPDGGIRLVCQLAEI